MVSMKDIASRCGVSVATVSKALNNQQDISQETKEKIRSTADEMGYYTNSAARALKTNRTYNIGVLFVDEQNSGLAHEYFSSVLDSLKVEAETNGYDITFINRNVGKKTTTYLQHALYRGVDGIVIACVNFNDPQVLELVNSFLPVVTIDHVFNNRIAVLSDNVNGMETLVDYVCSKGHKKIAWIHGEQSSVTENRMIGYYRALKKRDIIPDERYIRAGRYHDAIGCGKITRELLALPERPDCILFPDDVSALGGLNAIAEAGLKIPEDISAAGYDGVNLSRILTPVLTTYHQDTYNLGKAAASKLIELIENPKTVLLDRIIISGDLQKGGTVG